MTQASSNRMGSGSRHPDQSGLLSAGSLIGDEVTNSKDEKLGKIEEIMLDIQRGKVGYAVLASGGFLGIGDRLHAVPWDALQIDTRNKRFILDVATDRLKDSPGFDKDDWPDMADPTWENEVHSFYGTQPDSGTSTRTHTGSQTDTLSRSDTRPPPI